MALTNSQYNTIMKTYEEKQLAGRIGISGHIRGYVQGEIDADVQGILKGDMNVSLKSIIPGRDAQAELLEEKHIMIESEKEEENNEA